MIQKKLTPSPDAPLKRFFEEVYVPLKLTGARPRSIEHHRMQIGHLQRFLQCEPTVGDLTDETLAGLMNFMLANGKSRRTVNNAVKLLSAEWRVANARRFIDTLPALTLLREPERVPTAWTMEDVAKILQSCLAERRHYGPIPAGHWWFGYVLVLLDTGFRATAALHLTWRDVLLDREPAFAIARAEWQKTNRDEPRTLSPQTVQALRVLQRYGGRDVFPFPRSRTYLWRAFARIVDRAGLPSGESSMLHKLRRTSATFAEIHCGPGAAMKHLGHVNGSCTRRYIDPTLVPMLDVAAAIPRPKANLLAGATRQDEPLAPYVTWGRPECGRIQQRLFDRQVHRTLPLIRDCLKALDWKVVADLDAAGLLEWFDGLRKAGIADDEILRGKVAILVFARALVDAGIMGATVKFLSDMAAAGAPPLPPARPGGSQRQKGGGA